MKNDETAQKVRLDKWLWAARFFKTRSNAADAVAGGKVHVNGARVKPARAVNVGDELRIRRDEFEFNVVVRGLSEKRRQAAEAQQLYEETPQSMERRAEVAAQKRVQRILGATPPGRPDKKSRRRLMRAKKGADS